MFKTSYLNNALGIVPEPVILSLESVAEADGVTRVEKEIEIYGTLANMDELDKAADWEIQEQWGLYVPNSDKNAGSGNTRVRMIQDSSNKTSYVFTAKVKRSDGNSECEIESTADMFNLYKLLAESGLRKKRYFFPIEGTEMTFEVDVFSNANGTPVPHVKIDLEIKGDLPGDFDFSSINLPFELNDIRVISPGRKNEDDLAYVRKLFSEQYDIPNQHIDKALVDKSPAPEQPAMEGDEGDHEFRGDYHSPNPLTPEGFDKTFREGMERDVPEELSKEVEDNKDALLDIATRCEGIKGVLSYNGSKREATLKQQLNETSMAITALLLKK